MAGDEASGVLPDPIPDQLTSPDADVVRILQKDFSVRAADGKSEHSKSSEIPETLNVWTRELKSQRHLIWNLKSQLMCTYSVDTKDTKRKTFSN